MLDGLPLAPSAELRSRILEATRREWSPTRRGVAVARGFLAGAIALELLLFFSALGGFHPGGRSAPFVVATKLGWAVVAVAATFVVFGRRSMDVNAHRWLLGAAVAIPAVLFAWMDFGTVWRGTSPRPTGAFTNVWGLVCCDLTLAMGLLPMLSLLLFQRKSRPEHPGPMGAASGAMLGAWAGLVVHLACPVAFLPHVLIGHVLPVALLSAFGWCLGRGLSR